MKAPNSRKIKKPTETMMAMAECFAKACRKERRILQTNELPLAGDYVSTDVKTGKKQKTILNRNGVNHHFGNVETFVEFTIEKFSAYFANVIEDKIYIPKQLAILQEVVGKFNRFAITTAVANAPVHKQALKTLKYWAKENKAKILVLPSDNNFEHINELFHDDPDLYVVFDETSMNNSLFISNMRVQANSSDPLNGKGEIAKRQNKSMIIASPKVCQLDIPNKKGEAPLRLMATGAITKPNYDSLKYTSLAKNYKATEDHICGALIVEIKNDEVFYNRHIEFENGGAFIDKGVRYTPKNTKEKINDAIMVMGDLHSISKDVKAFQLFAETIAPMCGVNEFGIQDFVDGESISHHDKDRVAKKAFLALDSRLTLTKQLKEGAKDLNYLTNLKHTKKVFIVPSNHNEFVDRWLDASRWIKDSENAFIGSILFPYCVASYAHRENNPNEAVEKLAEKLELAPEVLKKTLPHIHSGKSPVQVGIELYGVNHQEKIKWLDRDEHYVKFGVELGHHGDVGANGAKFSARTSGLSYGKCMVGHSHTAYISPNSLVWVVGCLEHLNPEYARGASSWSHTCGIVYPNGARQLLTMVDGHCFLED